MNIQTEIHLLVAEQQHILLSKLDKVIELNSATNSNLDLHKRIGFQIKIAHHLLRIDSMIAQHQRRVGNRIFYCECESCETLWELVDTILDPELYQLAAISDD